MRLSQTLALLVLASPLAAQPSLGLEYRAMYTDSEVIADPAGLRASVGGSKGRGTIWFAVERLKGLQHRFGNTCINPLPGGCPPDGPLVDTVSIAGGELGYAYPLSSSRIHSVDASLCASHHSVRGSYSRTVPVRARRR